MPLSLGEKLKLLRTKRGLSLEEAADKINAKFGTTLNKGMLSKWENGLTEPRLETIRVLALFFDVSLDYLIGLEEDEQKDAHIETIAAHHEGDEWTEEELKLIEDFKQFVRSQRKK